MTMSPAINTWEDEGGAARPSTTLNGTVARVKWAERIHRAIGPEFDRVVAARRWAVVAAAIARHQTLITGGVYAGTIVLTLAIVALLV